MSKKKNQVSRREALHLMGAAGTTALAVGGTNSAFTLWPAASPSAAAEAIHALPAQLGAGHGARLLPDQGSR